MKKAIIFIIIIISFCFSLKANSKIFINLNGGLTIHTSTINDNWTDDYYKESYLQKNSYKEKTGYNIGLDISYMFLNNGGINISMERTFSNMEGEFYGEYPHPFYFNSSRKINWTKDISFNITQFDLNFIYGFGSSMTFKSYAFFGLSFFQGKPAFLTSVTFNEVYPYDVLQIKEDIYNKKSYNSTGFNIGVSFYKKIVSKISIGIKIKYSYGKFDINRESSPNMKIPLQNLKLQASLSYNL
jgi:hypothetical protein